MNGHIPRCRIRHMAIFMLFVLLVSSLPAAAAQTTRDREDDNGAVLDLPSMTLTPADLTEAGLRRYRLNFGELHTFDETVAIMAEDQDLPDDEVRDLLEETGFKWWYESALYLRPDEDDPAGDVTSVVRSYVLQFADDAGAADAWDLLEDESGDGSAEDIRRVEDFGDESEATRLQDGGNEAIDLSFRLGNLHAGVLLLDLTGERPDLADVEALASILLDRIETVLDGGGPGLSGQALRLTGDDVEASVDNYLLLDGEAIHFYYESRTDRRDREEAAADSGATDEYAVWQLLSPMGDGLEDDVWYFVAIERFTDEDAASDWLAGVEDRVGERERLADFEIDDSAPTFGDDSVTYTVSQSERPIFYRNVVMRVGESVADISLQGPESPASGAIEALAELQIDCLETGDCFEPAPVPDALTAYIEDLGEPERNGDEDEASGDGETAVVAPGFRGGPAHTGMQPGPGPEGELAVRWELELPVPEDYVTSPVSPSFRNGVLYVLRQEGLHAIDAASGDQLWLVEAHATMDFSPPVIDGGTVYFVATDGVFAIDAESGEVLWQIDEPGANGTGPAAIDGRLYLMRTNGELLALDGESGEELWRVLTGSGATPSVVDGVVYVAGYIYEGGPEDGDVFWALDAETGEELWHVGMETGVNGPPAVTDGMIFGGGDNGILYALNAATGAEVWRFEGALSDQGGADSVPAVAGGVVYYGSWDATLVALEAESGDLIWEREIGYTALFPVVAGDAVYVFPRATLLVLDAETGEDRARLDDLGAIVNIRPISGPEFIETSPIVVDGVVFVVLENGVVAIEGSD